MSAAVEVGAFNVVVPEVLEKGFDAVLVLKKLTLRSKIQRSMVGISLSVTKEDTKYGRVPHNLLYIVVVLVVVLSGKQLQPFGPNVLLKIPHTMLGKLVQ